MCSWSTRRPGRLALVALCVLAGVYIVSFAFLVYAGHDPYWWSSWGFFYATDRNLDRRLYIVYYPIYQTVKTVAPIHYMTRDSMIQLDPPPE